VRKELELQRDIVCLRENERIFRMRMRKRECMPDRVSKRKVRVRKRGCLCLRYSE
jgi:hypothetical protein